jgi:hypothetical protein
MSGPGCDQPVLDRNICKNKIASSISHLYERPRTWLEGYHSSGWGLTPEKMFAWLNVDYAYGANIYDKHGLYYTTYGSWWEWAPRLSYATRIVASSPAQPGFLARRWKARIFAPAWRSFWLRWQPDDRTACSSPATWGSAYSNNRSPGKR